jgi:hypothetical protein
MPDDYRVYGNLADAQSQDPTLAGQAAANYRLAAERVQAFLAVQTDSAEAATELAWYLANLRDMDQARILAETTLPSVSSSDIALRLAGVFRRLGDQRRELESISRARELGIAERFIESTPWLAPRSAM